MNRFLPHPGSASHTDRTQGRLLSLAAIFVLCYALALTISPAARFRDWSVSYPLSHWLGVLAWLAAFVLAHRQTSDRLPDRDPYLLPIAGLITGWGLMTIWRVTPGFGFRQTFWLVVVIGVTLAGLRLPSSLGFLRSYKYLWLTGGLILTALTLFLGTNPSGSGPRLWLGCCGVYFQPSEPLKLLLVVYLAAYLADRQFLIPHLLPLLAPTLILITLALLLLIFQRDLGTATIFLFLYASVVFIATGRRRVLVILAAVTGLAGIAGFQLFDVVRLRIEAWVNPWLDPSGRSFQIVQSLLAVAAGGLFGRGPGLGSPTLVPVQHSDFIYVAIAEEAGLVGALGLILLIGLLAARGLRAAFQSGDNFRRYLAFGLTTYLVAQSILILGGNLRLLPLTGVTLPFVSYGGSSLLTSFLALLFLLHISNQQEPDPAPIADPHPYFQLSLALFAGLGALALVAGWWGLVRGPDLLTRTDNPRRVISDRYTFRGTLLDRRDVPLAFTSGQIGSLERRYSYPPLSPVIGYSHPVYGQSGLEESLDEFLRGTRGQPQLRVWWSQLLFGQPPTGLDVRLSLDLNLQQEADLILSDHTGALVLLKSRTGEILVMSSHPNFDPNTIDQEWQALTSDPRAPLLNRVTQGSYPPGGALGPLLLAKTLETGQLPDLPTSLDLVINNQHLLCSSSLEMETWSTVVGDGCPGPAALLAERLGGEALLALLNRLGFYRPPELRLPARTSEPPSAIAKPANTVLGGVDLLVSPLQMALAYASMSAEGVRPAPRLAVSINLPDQGWVLLDTPGRNETVLDPASVEESTRMLSDTISPIWQSVSLAPNGPDQTIIWYIAGTNAFWTGSPLTLVLVLEEDNPSLAREIGKRLLQAAMQP